MHGHHVFIIILITLFCGGARECEIDREVGRGGDDAGPTDDGGPVVDDSGPVDDGGSTDDGGPVEDADTPIDEDGGLIEDAPVVFISAQETAISVQFRENVEYEPLCNGDVSWSFVDSFGPCEVFSAEPCTETVPPLEVYDLGVDAVTVSYEGSPPIAVEYDRGWYTHMIPEPLLAGAEVTVTINIPDLPPIERHITLTSIDFERPETYGDVYRTADHDFGEDLVVEWDAASGGYGNVMFDIWSEDLEDGFPFYDVKCQGTYDDGGYTIPWTVIDTYVMSTGDFEPDITLANWNASEEIVDGVKVIESIFSVDLAVSLNIVEAEWP